MSSTSFQHVFTRSTLLNDLFKCPSHWVQQSVECMLKQMLKLKWALTDCHSVFN